APGGEMSNRTEDGRRKNARQPKRNLQSRDKFGFSGSQIEPSQTERANGKSRSQKFREKVAAGAKLHTTPDPGGQQEETYVPPVLANPGNVIKCRVGGGHMGSPLAHDNEARFPEALAEAFIRSFCPPGGIVLDCFSGSGTTGAVAMKTGRHFVGIDIRESQCKLTRRRLQEIRFSESFGELS
ncbi:MAG: site-specific DNA-methyltransferase, partial [Planctomycetota bacterium]|nr:site-specific DNA-methyltransferase [Planctomycetota bacterium]